MKAQDELEPARIGFAAARREWKRLELCINEAWDYLRQTRSKLYQYKVSKK